MRRETRGKEVKNDRSIEVPTEENMNRPKATRPGGADFKKGGSVSSASKRADGIAMKGKTKGRIVMKAGDGLKAKTAPSKMGKVKTSPKRDGVAKKGLTKGKMVGMKGR
jgi:hypothetical protein